MERGGGACSRAAPAQQQQQQQQEEPPLGLLHSGPAPVPSSSPLSLPRDVKTSGTKGINSSTSASSGNQPRRRRHEPSPEVAEDEEDDEDEAAEEDTSERSSSGLEADAATTEVKPMEAPPNASDHQVNAQSDDDDDEDDGINEASIELRRRQAQLENDVEVLAAHLEAQAAAIARERAAMAAERQELERGRQDLAVEVDALRHQHAALQRERDELLFQARTTSESHDELLAAIRTQQQREEHARAIVMNLVKERDGLRKQLDESKTYARRVEDELVSVRAEVQHLRGESRTLQAALTAATTGARDRETRLASEQAQAIDSLRADLVAMEFEYQTLAVDKERLGKKYAALQRQSEHRDYDVISLNAAAPASTSGKPRLTVVTTGGGSGNGNSSSNSKRRGPRAKDGDGDGGGFANLMSLPNYIDERHESGSATPSSGRARSLVAKTISSAKKKLFSPSHAATVVLPQ